VTTNIITAILTTWMSTNVLVPQPRDWWRDISVITYADGSCWATGPETKIETTEVWENRRVEWGAVTIQDRKLVSTSTRKLRKVEQWVEESNAPAEMFNGWGRPATNLAITNMILTNWLIITTNKP
jgi:hypothetical protein